MPNQEVPYFPMHENNGSGIAFEHWSDERSVEMHRHHFYEIFMIFKGSSTHYYMGTETFLIPGDVLIVSPDQPHALSMNVGMSIFNIHFLPEVLSTEVRNSLIEDGFLMAGQSRSQPERMRTWQEVSINKADYYKYGELQLDGYEINKNRQGVIHLGPQDITFVRQISRRALNPEAEAPETEILLKSRYLEILLLTVKKAFDHSREVYSTYSKENQRAISETLMYIENHISEKMDFDSLALSYGYSPNYFRRVFRNITGFSPVQYVNRMRVTIATNLMQQENMSPSEAAYHVGVYDMNYFVRMFKKIMGETPGKISG